MAWVRIDDQIAFNAKVVLAGNAALGAWLRGCGWASAHRTGGFVPEHIAKLIAPRPVWLRLASAKPPGHQNGLVILEAGGYRIHDFLAYNPAASIDPELSEKRAEAGRRGAAARWGDGGKVPSGSQADPMADGWQDDASRARPVPTRPDPTDQNPLSPPRDSSAPASPPPPDPWGLVPDGTDPDAPLSPPAGEAVKPKGSKPDLALELLSPFERRIHDAIVADADLAPICKRPAQLARDLNLAAPAVDVVREVRSLGAWLRANPAKRKSNGNSFLLRNVARKQERGNGSPREHEEAPRRPEREAEAPRVLVPPHAPALAKMIADRAAAEARGEAPPRPEFPIFDDIGRMPEEDAPR